MGIPRLILKSITLWLLMVRDAVLAPVIGANIALPLSGITLSLLVLPVAYLGGLDRCQSTRGL